MAISTCIKCGGIEFEMKEVEPKNSKFKVNFVQCSSCGGVVGIMDYYSVSSMLDTLAVRLNAGHLW